MTSTHTLLCRYRYDPLDRLATCSPTEQDGIQRFYQKNRLTTEIQGQIQRAFFQTDDQLLAQHQGSNACTLLATDQQRSVLDGLDASQRQSAVYTPYGARHPQANPLQLLGFTGERADPVTGYYLLGNGYRAFNPVLMRFNSPDSLSPFGRGGLNAYAYCIGDPVNSIDPSGHMPILKPINPRRVYRYNAARGQTRVTPTAMTRHAFDESPAPTPSAVPLSELDQAPEPAPSAPSAPSIEAFKANFPENLQPTYENLKKQFWESEKISREAYAYEALFTKKNQEVPADVYEIIAAHKFYRTEIIEKLLDPNLFKQAIKSASSINNEAARIRHTN